MERGQKIDLVIHGETGEIDVKTTFLEAFRIEAENNLIQRIINSSHCNEKEVKEMNENINRIGPGLLHDPYQGDAPDITYALEAAKDINVEDAYPKGPFFATTDEDGDVTEIFVDKSLMLNGPERALALIKEVNDDYDGNVTSGGVPSQLTPYQSHQLRGMVADFDGDQFIPSEFVHHCITIRHPSKYKKGPRKGRAFLHARTVRRVIHFGKIGTSIHYVNEFRKVK